MLGMSLFTMLLSMLLSASVIIYLVVILYKHAVSASELDLQSSISLLCLLIAVLISTFHMIMKNKLLIISIRNSYYSTRISYLIITICYLLLCLCSLYLTKIHKDITTYLCFSLGMIYYMSSFLICPKSMKRYYFSLRYVMFDGLYIGLLVGCSRFYSILHYQIPNVYQLIGAGLLVAVLYIYALTIFISVNIIKKDED